MRTRLHKLQTGETVHSRARTGISLHCHTQFSKENLDFLPCYADRIPIIARLWRREYAAYRMREQRDIDFDTAYWTPPLTPELVYSSEKDQISDIGLKPIVSITDHDCIEANLIVNSSELKAQAPISMEWTVPFDCGFFHLGIHNLPAQNAETISKTLLNFTFDDEQRSAERLDELFLMLSENEGVMIVLNHPLWDIEMVGNEKHKLLLNDFLQAHGQWIHALEVNGFRTWSENKKTIELAESLGLPVVAGGDRHGCRPNTVINISDCDSFEEYAEDVRTNGRNQVALMPQYERPLCSRQLESFSEILDHYPQLPVDRERWVHRIFFDIGDGNGLQSIRELGVITGPLWMRGAIRTLGILGSPRMALLFRFARRKADRVPKQFDNSHFELNEIEDIAANLSSEPVI
ncbi:MAG: PHP domain-containing protein [Pyrinomonadaceae bacterium]